jgi:hypothetical protein
MMMLDLNGIELSIWTSAYGAAIGNPDTQASHGVAIVLAYNAVLFFRTNQRTEFPNVNDRIWDHKWDANPTTMIQEWRLTCAQEMYRCVLRASGYKLKESE